MANDYEDELLDNEDNIYTDEDDIGGDESDTSIQDIIDQIKEIKDSKNPNNTKTASSSKKANETSKNKPTLKDRAETNKHLKKYGDTEARMIRDISARDGSDALKEFYQQSGHLDKYTQTAKGRKWLKDNGLEDFLSKNAQEALKKGAGKAAGQAATGASSSAAGGAAAGTTAAGGAAAGGAAAGGAAAGGAGASAGGAAAAGGPYVWLAIAIIVAVIVLIMLTMALSVTLMSSAAATAAAIEEQSKPENMQTNSLITDDYFYGIRTIYIDDTELANSLQLSYKQYLIDIIANIGENNADATINISLPSVAITNQSEIDAHITNMSVGIGNIIATGSTEYDNVDFLALYPQIEYFGMAPSQVDSVNTFITDYIKDNNLITIEGKTIDALVDNAINHADLQYIYNVCEKVMIKDEVATADGISGLQQRKYIASIYMPNKNIIITSSSHIVSTDSEGHTNHIKLIEKTSKDDKIYINESVDEIPYIQDGVSQITKITLEQFDSIDTQNLEAFSSGLSLFDAIKLSSSYSSYFKKSLITNVYTWKPTDSHYLYLQFEPNSEFIFGEFELSVLWAD